MSEPNPPTFVPNYLGPAIVVALFCCPIPGIPAILYAAQVNNKLAAGDVAGAMESSRKAKLWVWVTFWVGIAANVITVIVSWSSIQTMMHMFNAFVEGGRLGN